MAKEAPVFMVVGINGSWKIPCYYFFIYGLSGAEKASLVKICVKKLYDPDVYVVG